MFKRFKSWVASEVLCRTNTLVREGIATLTGSSVERTVDIALWLILYAVYTIVSWIDGSISMFQLLFFIPVAAGATVIFHKMVIENHQGKSGGTLT